MPEAVLTFLVATVSYLGLALLALSQHAHWRAVTGGASPCSVRARGLRVLATLKLMLALVLSWHAHGPAFGSLLWVMLVSAAAMAVAFTLSWRPRALACLAPLLGRSGAARVGPADGGRS